MPDVNKVALTRVWNGTAWQPMSEDARFVQNDGDTMTGPLVINTGAPALTNIPLQAGNIRVYQPDANSIFMLGTAPPAVTATTNSLVVGRGALAQGSSINRSTILGTSTGQGSTGQIADSLLVGYQAGAYSYATNMGSVTAVGSQAQANMTPGAAGDYATAVGTRALSGGQAVAVGAFAEAAANSIAIGAGTGGVTKAHTTAANTVQLLVNTTIGTKVYAGVDRLIALAELKAVVAASADFADFKVRMAALT